MPSLPLSLALPAATASLAYLNARHGIGQDVSAIYKAITMGRSFTDLEERDRMNTFYRFEELATDPKFANRPFLIVPQDDKSPQAKTQWTYAEAYTQVLKYAAWLKEAHGVKKNEIIAMNFKNSPQFVWMWFGLWSLGAIAAFINSNLRDSAFTHCVNISTTRLLIVAEDLQEVLTDEVKARLAPEEVGRAIETVILDSAVSESIESLQPYRAPDAARSGAMVATPAILIYTSGTTGLPKAANVVWGKPTSGWIYFPKILRLTVDDRYYTAMPLYHSSASVLGVCQALGPGCAIVLGPKFSPRSQMKQISETGATVMQYIGEMCRYLVTSPPSPYDKNHNLRLAFGNGMRPDVWQKFKDRFNIPAVCEFYGATEAPGASYVYSQNSFYRGAIGRSGLVARTFFGGVSALIKHDHETDEPWRNPKTGFCEKVQANENGELIYLLDPENISDKFQGYLGNEKASTSKIIRDVFAKGDAYYRSGDLQRLDSDGRWWFIDRIGDTFRWKGENVSTAEVSEVLGTHPSLQEANVYGVSLPNHDGRAGCAAMSFASPNITFDDKLATDLATLARKRLPKYAVPLFLRRMQALEVTGTLKHQKVTLRNEGVDPSKTGQDDVWWLPPGGEKYVKFGKEDWDGIVGGKAKL